MTHAEIDCVLVGHNDTHIDRRAQHVRALDAGIYEDIKTNSVVMEGRRLGYMELLSRAIHIGTGRDLGLNVFRMPSAATCYLASYLRRRGYCTAHINSFQFDRERFGALLDRRPRAVAITTTFYVDDDPIAEIVEFVRKRSPTTTIIVGGPRVYGICARHDPLAQDYIFTHSLGADLCIVDAQGEATLAAVLGALRDGAARDFSRIPNLVWSDGRAWHRTRRVPETNDLDHEAVDWATLDDDLVGPAVALRTARSCPYACAFCNYPTMAGQHVVGAVETLERELRSLSERGVKHISFIDDTFNVPLPRFKSLLRMMIRNQFDFEWVSFFRCSNADDETFDLMRQAGCLAVFLGIESGDAVMLQRMNKKATPAGYRYGTARLKSAGIATFTSMIVGYPGETADSVRASIDFIDETAPTFFNPQLYYHDRLSPIHASAREYGLQGAGYGWSHDGMSWREAAEWVKTMFRDVVNSTPLTLDGFSVWALTYLRQFGLTIPQIQAFGDAARPMLVAGFDERPVDVHGAEFQRMVALFGRDAVAEPARSTAVHAN
jgi:p-methyltransferase